MLLEIFENVGCLIRINSIRFDIVLETTYLSWFVKAPLQHHLNMAIYVLEYLNCTQDLPLVLGGNLENQLNGYTDAALGKGPKLDA